MKNIVQYIILAVVGSALMACEKDNYEPPNALLSGRLLYQGEPIYVEYDRVSYDLYQDGFGKTGPLGSTFTQEGEFSQLLFDGDYKMVIPGGQGPFVTLQNDTGGADTILIDLRGNTTTDIEVTPFWMIRNPQLAAGGRQRDRHLCPGADCDGRQRKGHRERDPVREQNDVCQFPNQCGYRYGGRGGYYRYQ